MKKIKDPQLFAHIKKFLTVYMPKVRNKSDNTIASYKFTLNLYLLFLEIQNNIQITDVMVTDFNQHNILAFMEWLKTTRNNEVTTINQRLSNIRYFCEFLTKNNLLDISDMSAISEIKKISDTRKRAMLFLTLNQMKNILAQPDTTKKAGLRDKFFIALLYDSGCRDQEILDLRVRDLVPNNKGEGELHIIGKGNKYRVTPISKDVVNLFFDYLKIYHADESKRYDNYLFYTIRNEIVSKMSADNVQRFLKKYEMILRESDPSLIHLHPHLFRHTRAMHLYIAGVPLPLISEWLGHSNMETTRIYYVKIFIM